MILSYGTTVVYVWFITDQSGITRSMTVHEGRLKKRRKGKRERGAGGGTALFPLGSLAEPG